MREAGWFLLQTNLVVSNADKSQNVWVERGSFHPLFPVLGNAEAYVRIKATPPALHTALIPWNIDNDAPRRFEIAQGALIVTFDVARIDAIASIDPLRSVPGPGRLGGRFAWPVALPIQVD